MKKTYEKPVLTKRSLLSAVVATASPVLMSG
ncbi:putative RiPP precursor [Mesorhizobium sp. KR9-304]